LTRTDSETSNGAPDMPRDNERTNSLLQQYIYIDRLLDSSLPHNLLNEYSETPGSKTATNHENIDMSVLILEESARKFALR
jgi:hypothetical protein